MKIKIHSSVDLITNSSTTIFTYSEGSLDPLKKLVNEILKVFERTETFDDIFYAGVFLENWDHYIEELDRFGYVYDDDYIRNTIDEVLKGSEKPDWMIEAESSENSSGYNHESFLKISVKDEKYQNLAKLLLTYLYSTDHEAAFE